MELGRHDLGQAGMSETLSIPEFLITIVRVKGTLAEMHHSALECAGQIVETEAKRVIGTYDYNWVELADATKEDRVSQGFPENEPLLRTGEMRDSIEHRVEGDTVHIGSDNDKAVWQELGTVTIPPRSFLKGAVEHKLAEIEEAIGRTVVAHLASGGRSSAGHEFDIVAEIIK